jgi:hypothetical protein
MAGISTFRGPTVEQLRRWPRRHPLQVKIDSDLDMAVRELCASERRSACSLVNMVLREFLKPHGK